MPSVSFWDGGRPAVKGKGQGALLLPLDNTALSILTLGCAGPEGKGKPQIPELGGSSRAEGPRPWPLFIHKLLSTKQTVEA